MVKKDAKKDTIWQKKRKRFMVDEHDFICFDLGKYIACLVRSISESFASFSRKSCNSEKSGIREKKKDITELKYDPNSGRLADQDDMPLGSTVDSKGVVPLKDRDRVLYLLAWIAKEAFVLGLPEPKED